MESTTDILRREKDYWESKQEFKWLRDTAIQDVIDQLPPFRGDVLELCRGSGMFSEFVPRNFDSYTALDLSSSMLKVLKSKLPHVKTVVGNAENPELPEQSFDLVIIFAGLHHLPHRELALKNIFRLLKPGGRFICFEPNKLCWYRKPILYFRDFFKIYTEDEEFLSPYDIESLASSAGFKNCRTSFCTPSVTPFHRSLSNIVLARSMDIAASVSRSVYWQAWFILIAEKNAAEMEI